MTPTARTRRLPKPCQFPPGSPGKIEALARRAAAGQVLFHPDDAVFEPVGWADRLDEAIARRRDPE